jgi:type II secretory pathway component PulF
VLWWVLAMPLWRQERTRFFLDLLESGLARGESAEAALAGASESGDRTLGRRFHWLGLYLRAGARLSEGLKAVPKVVSPQVAAMLEVGEHLGDVRKVLPACRQALTDATSRVSSDVNVSLVCLTVNLCGPALWLFLCMFIVPKFKDIFRDLMEGQPLPPLFMFLDAHSSGVVAVLIGLFLVVCATITVGTFERWRVMNRLAWWLPWRRKRLQRDFSAMLAMLLDAGVTEAEAVRLAAGCTANEILIARSDAVAAELAAGAPLTAAVAALDDSGEFRWRLENAAHGHGGFHAALAGWHEALTARAYQQEQAASQLVTTGLVLLNGVVVGVICVGVFQALAAVLAGVGQW